MTLPRRKRYARRQEHLLGLQAQATLPPYFGLWSRLEGFDPTELGRMLTERVTVRLTLMRGTVHLVTVSDALSLRPLMQPVIERSHRGAYGRRMGGADLGQLAATVHELLALGPLGARELGRRLVERGIGDDAEAIGNAARVRVPLVQVPPRGVWGAAGHARYATLEAWTGRELEAEPSIDVVVSRYLGAFGPASVLDVQNWSGLTRLKPVLERLRPRLVTFRDGQGKELFTCPTRPGRIRTSVRRRASSASTTTPCSAMPTAGGSSRRTSRGGRCSPPVASSTTCSWTRRVRKPVGHAAWAYSWMSPPRRSRLCSRPGGLELARRS